MEHSRKKGKPSQVAVQGQSNGAPLPLVVWACTIIALKKFVVTKRAMHKEQRKREVQGEICRARKRRVGSGGLELLAVVWCGRNRRKECSPRSFSKAVSTLGAQFTRRLPLRCSTDRSGDSNTRNGRTCDLPDQHRSTHSPTRAHLHRRDGCDSGAPYLWRFGHL